MARVDRDRATSSGTVAELIVDGWAVAQGLQSRSSLNGAVCRIRSWHDGSGRWSVKFSTLDDLVRVKPSNLQALRLPAFCVRGAKTPEGVSLQSKLQEEVELHLASSVAAGVQEERAAAGIRCLFEGIAASDMFMTEFFGRRPFVMHCGGAVASVWTMADQLRLLTPDAWPGLDVGTGPIRLEGFSRFTHPDISRCKVNSFMVGEENRSLSAEVASERVDAGCTWVVSSGCALAADIAHVCGALQSTLGSPFVNANVYISRLNASVTAPLHTDRWDSFVFQTEGSKRWRVFGISADLPLWPVLDAGMKERGKYGDVLFVEQVGPLLLDECLCRGDVLYLPRGHPHATSTFDTVPLQKEHGDAYSTSLTVSLLLESLGLTYDKLLRCAAGMYEGCNQGQCKAAEQVLRATSGYQCLREVLPLGFLARKVLPKDHGQSHAQLADSWAGAVVQVCKERLDFCGVNWLSAAGAKGESVLFDVARHVWNQVPAAVEFCQDRVYATGGHLSAFPPDSRNKEDKILEFQFYPEEGRIFVAAPTTQQRSNAF